MARYRLKYCLKGLFSVSGETKELSDERSSIGLVLGRHTRVTPRQSFSVLVFYLYIYFYIHVYQLFSKCLYYSFIIIIIIINIFIIIIISM